MPFGQGHGRFGKLLREILLRLPEEAYDEICMKITFVVPMPSTLGINVPIKQLHMPGVQKMSVSFRYVVVIFKDALEYPDDALKGIIVHELAHSFVEGQDYTKDEKLTDELVVEWGFQKELDALHNYKK